MLGPANGPLPCDVLFVGEAPGRRGAASTGIPFCGDQSGARFETLLAAAGLRRDQVFITNAVLCLPLEASGRNRTPAWREVLRCRPHLLRTIALVQPRVVATLGAVALRAVTDDPAASLSALVAKPKPLGDALLFPLYHPGRQAELHRPWPTQLEDWRRLGELLR